MSEPWFATLAQHFAEELVDRWHDFQVADAPATLAAFMGLTETDYAAWVEGRYVDVAAAIEARAARMAQPEGPPVNG